MTLGLHRNHTAAVIDAGGVAICMSVRMTKSVEIALLAKGAGFDALYVDLEHGSVSASEAGQIFATALGAGVTPLVRLPHLSPHLAASLLDNGALGLIIPHVHSAAALKPLLDACAFAPLGSRSTSGVGVHFGFAGGSKAAMARDLAAETTVIVMLEDRAAIAQAEAIAALPGVSGLMIGSNDFLSDLGQPGNYRSVELMDAYRSTVSACRHHGKFLGVAGIKQDKEMIGQLIQIGAQFITCGSDSAILASGLASQASTVRSLIDARSA